MMSTNNDTNNKINKLDIANGLKEMLINHQFTVENYAHYQLKISLEHLALTILLLK
jgi:hypothetical protein